MISNVTIPEFSIMAPVQSNDQGVDRMRRPLTKSSDRINFLLSDFRSTTAAQKIKTAITAIPSDKKGTAKKDFITYAVTNNSNNQDFKRGKMFFTIFVTLLLALFFNKYSIHS